MKTAAASIAAAVFPQFHNISWNFNLILGWMLQQAPMSMFLHGARTYILYNVMYCMLAVFDIKQSCCYRYHRVCNATRQIPLMCSAYSVGCADGIAESCCTIFYNLVVDPLSACLAATELLGNCNNNNNNNGKHGNSSDDIPWIFGIPGRHNGKKAPRRKVGPDRPPFDRVASEGFDSLPRSRK